MLCACLILGMLCTHTGSTRFDVVLSERRIEVSRCGLVRGTVLDEYVLALILKMMTGNLLKTIANWVVLTPTIGSDRVQAQK